MPILTIFAGVSAPPAWKLSASVNIGASAADSTTAQLTNPGGTFTAGRISDDTNPLPALDVGSGGYTEVEFCLQPTSDAVLTGTYEFRLVLSNGTPLDTYTVTPTATVVAASAFVPAAHYYRQLIGGGGF